MNLSMEHFDVIIVGAGMSGINAAYRLATVSPEKSFVILEARDRMGGTWDLWRYPGVRSDSDMFTFAYPFKKWDSDVMMASGSSINDYLKSAAADCGADKHIRCGHRVHEAAWSSVMSQWTVHTSNARFTSSFLFLCSGYYEYDDGHRPEFKGRDRFKGQLVHPIKWPENLNCSGQRIVVIGSGATAVSLVPKLARDAKHVTMLQRSPTYMFNSKNHQGTLHSIIRAVFPDLAARVARWWHMTFYMGSYWAAKTFPQLSKFVLIRLVLRLMPGQDRKHFTPRYKPWDERICRVSDGDMFEEINSGKVSVVTDEIHEFTEHGIRTQSGHELEADLIVSATGFNFMRNYPVGSINLTVNGKPYKPSETVTYKGCMLSEIPNLFFTVGYTNASWTLRSDLISLYVCRMLKMMDAQGFKQCCPPSPDVSVKRVEGTFGTLSSGYLKRSKAHLPMQGDRLPWYAPQYYLLDKLMLMWRSCDDGIMKFVAKTDPS